jgi:RND family efflux transporter MFP subunit
VNKKSKCASIILISLLLVNCIFIFSGCGGEEETVKESELTVTVAKARVQDIAKTSFYSGTIRGINEVNVIPKVAARVTAIHVQAGDYVREGQKLITLDSTDFAASIKQAQAAVAMAEAGKRANDVQKATALANYERTLKLHENGAVSDAQLEAAKAQYDALNSGSAEAAVEQAQAALLQAQTSIGYCSITAPIDGIVGAINISLGEMATTMSPAAIITDTSKLEVEISVSESEISYVEVGREVEVFVSAVSDQPFTGRVDRTSVAADPASKNFNVYIVLDNPDGAIKSGMFAQVAVSTVSVGQALCVPRNAVVPKGSMQVAYIIDKDSRARMIQVKTGIENSSYIEILEGLKEGQQVILKGNTLVEDGTKVRVVTGGEK